MGKKKKKEKIEYRYYELPPDEWVISKLGEGWIRCYGDGIDFLHFHNLVEVGFCREGTGILTLDDRHLDYEAGMISVIPKNYPHTTNSTPNTLSWWEYLFFDPHVILKTAFPKDGNYVKKITSLVYKNAVFEKKEEAEEIYETVKRIMEEMREENGYSREVVKGLMLSLVFLIARHNSEDEKDIVAKSDPGSLDAISGALYYVEEHFSEPIKIGELADCCAMSEAHFRKLFVEHMKMRPVEYINYIRIRAACDMLARTDKSVEEVAVSCGFSTPSTFNRNFNQILGITPNQWRKDPERYERKLLDLHISAEKGWE